MKNCFYMLAKRRVKIPEPSAALGCDLPHFRDWLTAEAEAAALMGSISLLNKEHTMEKLHNDEEN